MKPGESGVGDGEWVGAVGRAVRISAAKVRLIP